MKKFYKIKGNSKQYETPFDLMANEDIVKDSGLNEIENESGDISFYDFVKQANEILCKNCENGRSDNGEFGEKIGSSGNFAQIGSSGGYAQIGSSGYSAQICSSGDSAQICSSGDSTRIGSSGYSARIGSSGEYARIGSSGDFAQIGSSGYSAQICSSGDSTRIGSSGDFARIGSSGNFARIEVKGLYGIASSVGYKSVFKGVSGTWFSLADYKERDQNYMPCMIKAGQIGVSLDWKGKPLKENQYYMLIDGEFTPVLIADGYYMIPLSEKKIGEYKVYCCCYEEDYRAKKENAKKVYVAEKDGIVAHGLTIKKAIACVIFKCAKEKGVK
jgi:hypothetical protein